MNAEHSREMEPVQGEVKRQWGKLTDDDMTEAEGNYDKFLGRVQERYGDKRRHEMDERMV